MYFNKYHLNLESNIRILSGADFFTLLLSLEPVAVRVRVTASEREGLAAASLGVEVPLEQRPTAPGY